MLRYRHSQEMQTAVGREMMAGGHPDVGDQTGGVIAREGQTRRYVIASFVLSPRIELEICGRMRV